MIQGIIFDFDLTLVDSAKAICGNLNALASEKGLRQLPLEEVRPTIGMALVDAMRDFWGDGPVETDWLPRYRKLFIDRNYAGLEGFPQTVPALEKLKGMGLKLGIATNRLTPCAIVKAAGIDSYFEAIVGIDGYSPKPNPETVLKALSLIKVEPENGIYVGDTEIDMKTAVNGRVMGIGVTSGNQAEGQLKAAGASYVIPDLSYLPALIKELNS